MAIKLSICIPTYNRADYIGETLESIVSQATDEIEIVISDNASTDKTEEVVATFQQRFAQITYLRQPQNQGADRNYLKAVELAQGEYCWLLGSDDLIEPGAIRTLLDHYLNDVRPVDFVLLCGIVYNRTLQRVLSYSADEIGVTADIYTTDVLDFFSKFFCESGLSVYVVKRTLWSAVDPTKYLGTGLVYLGVVYEYLELHSPVQVVAKPLIKYRAGNASWSKDTLDIVIGHMQYVMDSLPDRYAAAKPEAMRRYRQRVAVTLRMLSSLRADGNYNLQAYHKHVAAYLRHRSRDRILAFIIALLPPAMLRGARTLSKASRQIGDGA